MDGKPPPCLPESVEAVGRPIGSSFLIASEFESLPLEKLAFCIFLCASRQQLPIIWKLRFSQLSSLKTPNKTRKHRTFVQCFPVLHLLATRPGGPIATLFKPIFTDKEV